VTPIKPNEGRKIMAGKVQINDGSVFLNEQAAAQTDITAYGQIWVKDSTPNELWFTDDAGNDVQLGTGGGFTSAASAYLSANQTIYNNSWTKVQFNAEHYDNDDEYDHATNYRFTAASAGKYNVSAMVYWYGVAAAGFYYLAVFKNGSLYKQKIIYISASPGDYQMEDIVTDVALSANDYIEIFAFHNTGASRTLYGLSSSHGVFNVHRIA
jgi:hypothetical protein